MKSDFIIVGIKLRYETFQLFGLLFVIFVYSWLLPNFSLAQSDTNKVELSIKGPDGIRTLVDEFQFSIKFSPSFPKDSSKVLIQYIDRCLERNEKGACSKFCELDENSNLACKKQTFSNLIDPKGIGESDFFAKDNNVITTKKLVLSKLGLNKLNTVSIYVFRVLVSENLNNPNVQKLESNLAQLTILAACNRQTPTVIIEPSEKKIEAQYSASKGFLSQKQIVSFDISIKNNDEEACNLFEASSKFRVKVTDFNKAFTIKTASLLPSAQESKEPVELSAKAQDKSTPVKLEVEVPELQPSEGTIKVTAEHMTLATGREVSVSSASAIASGQSVVKVVKAARPCERKHPLVFVSEGKELQNSPTQSGLVVPGETLSYDVKVIDPDFSECGPSNFEFVKLKSTSLSESEFNKWTFMLSSAGKAFSNVEGCEVTTQLVIDCPSRSTSFTLKSDPETEQSKSLGFLLCFKNVNTGKSNCDSDAPKFINYQTELYGYTSTSIYSGLFFYNTGQLPCAATSPAGVCIIKDSNPPKVTVKLSPEKPLPNKETKFVITTSDDLQMGSVELFRNLGSEGKRTFKNPEEHAEVYSKILARGSEHSFYAIATDAKGNQECFPEQTKVDGKCPSPSTAVLSKSAFKVEDRPDLIIESIGLKPQEPRVGDKLDVTITVVNVGTLLAGGFDVKLKANKPAAKELDTKTVNEVLPDKSVTLTFSIQLDKEGEWELEAIADAENKIEEADEMNSKVAKINVKSGVPTTGIGAAPETALSACEGNLEDRDKILSSTGKLYFACKSSDFKQTAQCNTVSNYPDEFNLNSAAFKCADTSKKCFISVVQEGCTSAQPSCSLSANPSSGTGSFTSTITVSYNRLTSAPNTITVDCGTGPSVAATGCAGPSGKCTATCNYPIVTSHTTYTASASIGNLKCSATTIKNNQQTTLSACEGSLYDVQKILSGTGKLYLTCKNKDFIKTLKCNPVSNYPDELNLNSPAFKCAGENKACYIAVTQDGCK